ncbi:8761_t:CDS:2, partial [Gigaspora rosea]
MSIQNHKRQLLALFELNQKEFIIRVVDNNWKPGYMCELDTEAIVYLISSAAINETYKKYFNIKTRFSGPSILSFDNEVVAEQLRAEILFFPFQITVYSITIVVVALGSSDQAKWNFAGPDIYYQENKIYTYSGKSPNDVWAKSSILKNYNSKDLFGLCDQLVIQVIQTHITVPYCKA